MSLYIFFLLVNGYFQIRNPGYLPFLLCHSPNAVSNSVYLHDFFWLFFLSIPFVLCLLGQNFLSLSLSSAEPLHGLKGFSKECQHLHYCASCVLHKGAAVILWKLHVCIFIMTVFWQMAAKYHSNSTFWQLKKRNLQIHKKCLSTRISSLFLSP